MILNKSQANAVAQAMCALNNVGGTLCCRFDGIHIEAWDSIYIQGPDSGIDGSYASEHYANQNEFFDAYGLE